MIVFLWILLCSILISLILSTASLKLIVKDIRIENIDSAVSILKILLCENEDKLKLEFLDYIRLKISLKLTIFNGIQIFSLNFDEKRLKKIMLKQLEKEIKNNKDIKEDKKKAKEISKKIIPELYFRKSKLQIEIGTDDAAVTAIMTSVISIIIAIVLPYITDLKNYKNYYYKVTPIYLKQNVFFLQFSCIITSRLIHIIKIMCSKKNKAL